MNVIIGSTSPHGFVAGVKSGERSRAFYGTLKATGLADMHLVPSWGFCDTSCANQGQYMHDLALQVDDSALRATHAMPLEVGKEGGHESRNRHGRLLAKSGRRDRTRSGAENQASGGSWSDCLLVGGTIDGGIEVMWKKCGNSSRS